MAFFYRTKLSSIRKLKLQNVCLSRVEYRVKTTPPEIIEAMNIQNRIPAGADDILAKFDEYGSTPPRTRLKIKNRDWDRKHKG